MQKRQSEYPQGRPFCVADAKHPVHRHGCYARYANADDQTQEKVLRFLCYPCGRTFSLLADHRLPYRALRTEQLEAHFDAQANGTAPPPATEKEKACAKRAWTRFAQRIGALRSVLGQMIQAVRPTAATLWRELRCQGTLADMLRLLSRSFHTSLLKDYLCLKPWGVG